METRQRRHQGSAGQSSSLHGRQTTRGQRSCTPYFLLGLLIGGAAIMLTFKATAPDTVVRHSRDSTDHGKPAEKTKKPHIVYFMADDLGWGDVSWNNPDVITPNIARLAGEGVLLNNSYSQPLCTPSRAAIMSGYYAHRVGLQHQILWSPQPHGLPLDVKLLPEKLRDVGYRTHMLGKWHLGNCKWEYTPTYRGFDSFYGYYNLLVSHFDKMHRTIQNQDVAGYDFRDNTGVVEKSDEYLTEMLVRRAEKLIKEHNVNEPMFMYFAIDLPKWPNEAPQRFEDLYKNVKNIDRRKLCAMVSAIDEAVGNLTRALKERGMWEDTLFVFFSDNGGVHYLAGSNWPLRGTAGTLFEGGSRVPGFVCSSALKKTGYVNNELIHITDFHTTILKLAGAEAEGDLDGLDVWDTISEGKPSPRTEMVYNIDDVEPTGSAIRVGDYKLIIGNPEIFHPRRSLTLSDGWHKPVLDGPQPKHTPVRFGELGKLPDFQNVTLLYNLKDDPIEKLNIAEKYPGKVAELKKKLKEYEKKMRPAINPPLDFEGANPDNYNGVWSPGWC
ncbi:arylsulfatase J-like [Ptychodera flava]|uniref:arylsulfatase J-like n=1 Tax=Ptychodera flava TaxID=63121 RepID=UPI00396A4A97